MVEVMLWILPLPRDLLPGFPNARVMPHGQVHDFQVE
jgi:hypothetical protein